MKKKAWAKRRTFPYQNRTRSGTLTVEIDYCKSAENFKVCKQLCAQLHVLKGFTFQVQIKKQSQELLSKDVT